MSSPNTFSVFEYGYLVCECDKEKLTDATWLPKPAFRWLEQRCLRDKESDDQRLLSLRTIGGVKVLQVKNYVGVIALPQQQYVEVLPKIAQNQAQPDLARQQLLMMLRTLKSFRHVETNRASVMTSHMKLMDVFVQQFIHSLQVIVQQGLKRDYLRLNNNQAWLKGKLCVSEQIKRNSIRRDRFFVEYDEYRTERPENSLLKMAVEKVYGLTRNSTLLQELNRLRILFEPIPTLPDIDLAFSQVQLDRHMQYYESPMAWAKLILKGNSPHCMQGNAEAISLLFPMEAVFESFVTAWMHQNLGDSWQVKAQSRAHSLVRYHERVLFQLRPDIWLIPRNALLHQPVICDMKWKIIYAKSSGDQRFNLAQSDFYQMLAYGVNHLQGEGDMLLIYPAHDNFCEPLPHPFEFHQSGKSNLRLWVVPFIIGDNLRNSRLKMPEGMTLIDQKPKDICH